MLFETILLSALLLQPYDVPFGTKDSCQILNTGDSDQYEFVRVQEVSTGRVVFQSPVKGGASAGVFVRSKQIKIDHKWAGDIDFHSPVVVDCEDGKTIRLQR